ncbi:tetratricopeptide repeat protein [Endothiovibrio diazotrophicus]
MSHETLTLEQALSRANAALKRGDLESADTLFTRILGADPKNKKAKKGLQELQRRRSRLGLLPSPRETLDRLNRLFEAGRLGEVIAESEALLKAHPEDPSLLNMSGDAYAAGGQRAAAIERYERALRKSPDNPVSLNNLGLTLFDEGRVAEAVERLHTAIAAHPDYSSSYSNLANICRANDDLERAIELYRQAIALQPESARYHRNLGNSYREIGNYPEALAHLRRANELEPHNADGHFALASILLELGDFEEGWREYEWRFGATGVSTEFPPHLPRWDGSFDLGDELILVHEQGLGDTLQFLRYGIELKKRLPSVSLAVPPKLIRLIEAAGIFDRLYPLPLGAGQTERNARWFPLLSVPGVLGVSRERPIVQAPYLRVDPAVRQRLLPLLPSGERIVVGINWQGNPNAEFESRRGRSFPLADLHPLATLPGVELLSLQRGAGSEQLAQCAFRDRFVDHQDAIGEVLAFEEVAAIMERCDLIITSDTAVAHLAGALGCPTWILLHSCAEWRWGVDQETTPWYPTARLFRQEAAGDWEGVVNRARAELVKFVESRAG